MRIDFELLARNKVRTSQQQKLLATELALFNLLYDSSWRVLLATRALDAVNRAVQLDDVARAGALVQTVDVLRHKSAHSAAPLQLRDGDVRFVWLRSMHVQITDGTARPVSPPCGITCIELLNRLRTSVRQRVCILCARRSPSVVEKKFDCHCRRDTLECLNSD